MQQAPYRLSQTIWSAFRAAKPIHRPRVHLQPTTHARALPCLRPQLSFVPQTRYYSEKSSDVEQKVQEAKSRIEDALDSRADAASQPDTKLKDPKDETIVHTNPEASSIVHSSSQDAIQLPPPNSPRDTHPSPLPSQSPSHTSPVRQRFASFMDNFQSHLFTASQRLNDLTGYSGIEALKNEIAAQESLVASSRKAVKETRSRYAAAIATRSTTQREVNDLLHRKHAWTPEDLERFTSLYRSDHANEQSEAAAQKSVSDAEARYEEASTKLARTILARYHEEQIWSDKIRQMSTWGTWGLMGLNVLLFVVFQIAIEPWRRRRLVKGFEEKVEVALRERDEQLRDMGVVLGAVQPNGDAAVSPATAGQRVEDVADHIAEQIVDAVSGTTATAGTPGRGGIEEAAESVTTREIASEGTGGTFASSATGYAYYEEAFRELFSERRLVVTQKEMTTVALESAVGGAAVMGLLLVLLRPR